MGKRLVQYVAVPALVVAGFVALHVMSSTHGDVWRLALVSILIADIATIVRGKLRDAAVVLVSLLSGLIVIELAAIRLEDAQPVLWEPRNSVTSEPTLGWGPARAGVARGLRFGADGAPIYEVEYTIDDTLLRHTDSAQTGPLVAFFGDSMTFGQGLRDGETLPQAFADLHDRKLRVLNFGFPGYGPQQFLRAIEAGRFDALLRQDLKLIVFQTAPWHAARSSCAEDFMARAPRYELVNGDPVWVGACAEGFKRRVRETLGNFASYRVFFRPINAVTRADIELYIAEISKAARLAEQKYGAAVAVLYMRDPRYLNGSGFSDDEIIGRFRAGGLQALDGSLDPKDFPQGAALSIPGDGHPTGIANRARAEILARSLGLRDLGLSTEAKERSLTEDANSRREPEQRAN